MNVFNNLIVFDSESPSTIKPDLAEKWQQGDDGRTVTFSLRPGIKWHNGQDLKASDIVWNMERGMAAEGTTTFLKSRFRTVASVEAPDDLTVKVNLKEPSASFLPNMAVVFVLMYPPFGPAPNSTEFQTPEHAVGTGPFKLKGYTKDVKFEYTKNDGYFKKDSAGRSLPYLDAVEMFILRGANGLAAWRTNKIDCGCIWDHTFITSVADQLRADFPGAKLVGRNTAQFHLQFNQREPWTNPLIRRAIFTGLDRLTFKELYRGGNSHYPPTIMLSQSLGGFWSLPDEEFLEMPGFRVKDGVKDPADLEEANRLFAEAGVKPEDIKLTFYHGGSTQDTGEIVQATLAEIGINVELVLLGSTGELVDRYRNGDFDLQLVQGGNGFDDPSDQPTRYLLGTSSENYGKWDRSATDAVYRQIDSTFDQMKRRDLAMQWQRMILEEAIASPLNYNYAVNGPHRYVFGLGRGHYSTHSGQRFEEVWIDPDLR